MITKYETGSNWILTASCARYMVPTQVKVTTSWSLVCSRQTLADCLAFATNHVICSHMLRGRGFHFSYLQRLCMLTQLPRLLSPATLCTQYGACTLATLRTVLLYAVTNKRLLGWPKFVSLFVALQWLPTHLTSCVGFACTAVYAHLKQTYRIGNMSQRVLYCSNTKGLTGLKALHPPPLLNCNQYTRVL